MKMEIKRRITY